MRYIAYVVSITSMFFFNSDAKAQSGFSTSRFVFGGGFGLEFSTFETVVGVAPTIGYQFTDRLTAGPGVIYQYYHYKDQYNDLKSTNYGGKLFASYLLTPFLLAHTEYELLDVKYLYRDQINNIVGSKRRTIGSFFVGGGYRQQMGPNSTIDLLLLYNLTETPYTPYSNPIIRLGIGIGL